MEDAAACKEISALRIYAHKVQNSVTNSETRNIVTFAYANTLITLVGGCEEKQVIMHQTLAQATDGRTEVMGLYRRNKTLLIAICWYLWVCKTAVAQGLRMRSTVPSRCCSFPSDIANR